MPEGNSEIPKKDQIMTPGTETDWLHTPISRRKFNEIAATGAAIVAVESTIGKVVPAEAKQESPTPEPPKIGEEQERTPEEKARAAQINCENFLTQVKKIDASVAGGVEGTSLNHANKLFTNKEFAKAQEIFERISDSLLKFATVRVLNEGLKAHPGKSYSWYDIREVMDHVVLTPSNPLSEIRNYLGEKKLIETKIDHYFWRGIPVKKVDKQGKTQEVILYSSLNYSEDLNEISAMAGHFSTEEGANAEAIMGGVLIAPPEKPKRQDLTGHLNWQYDRVVVPLESVKGAEVENSTEEEIPDKRSLGEKFSDWLSGNKNEPQKAKVLYARASEIIPTY